MPDYTVKPGDCVSSLSADKGFVDYHSIYDDPKNKDFRKRRPNPNTLAVGDVLFIPEKDGQKKESHATTKASKFVVAVKKPVKLRIQLVELDRKPVVKAAWQLKHDAGAANGTTKGDGLIEVVVPANSKSGDLTVTLPATTEPAAPKPAAAPAAGKGPPPYPAPIQTDDFTDTVDEGFVGKKDAPLAWKLQIGQLAPFDVDAGVVARLENLGYRANGELLTTDAAKTAAIKAFQKEHHLSETGAAADIQSTLRSSYDKI